VIGAAKAAEGAKIDHGFSPSKWPEGPLMKPI